MSDVSLTSPCLELPEVQPGLVVLDDNDNIKHFFMLSFHSIFDCYRSFAWFIAQNNPYLC